VDPTESINLLETVLRRLLRDVLGDSWRTSKGIDIDRLASKKREDQARRRGVRVSADLLDYTEFLELQSIILNSWTAFAPALGKRKYVEVYFDRLNGFRNPAMHSRDLLPFERDLLAGMVGEFRNLVVLHRSQKGPDMQHYPVIEQVADSLANATPPAGQDTGMRLDVGDTVTFRCRGTDPQGRTLRWVLMSHNNAEVHGDEAEGDDVTLRWQVTPEAVMERIRIAIRLSSGGQFHRYRYCDDECHFDYSVNPPT